MHSDILQVTKDIMPSVGSLNGNLTVSVHIVIIQRPLKMAQK